MSDAQPTHEEINEALGLLRAWVPLRRAFDGLEKILRVAAAAHSSAASAEATFRDVSAKIEEAQAALRAIDAEVVTAHARQDDQVAALGRALDTHRQETDDEIATLGAAVAVARQALKDAEDAHAARLGVMNTEAATRLAALEHDHKTRAEALAAETAAATSALERTQARLRALKDEISGVGTKGD